MSDHETFPSFNMFPRDWILGTVKLTAEQKGWFIDMLCYAWEQSPPCTLPNDEAFIATRILGTTVQRWRRVGKPVRDKFDVIDGNLRNAKQYHVYCEMVEHRMKRKNAGSAGGRARAARAKHGSSNASSNASSKGGSKNQASNSLASSKEEAVRRPATDGSVADITARLLARQGTDG